LKLTEKRLTEIKTMYDGMTELELNQILKNQEIVKIATSLVETVQKRDFITSNEYLNQLTDKILGEKNA